MEGLTNFFKGLKDKKVDTKVESIATTLTNLYVLEEKESKADEKDRKKEDKLRRRKEQSAKRKKADTPTNPILALLKGKGSNGLSAGLSVMLLGLLGVGTAIAFREQIATFIGGKVLELKDNLQSAIDDGIADITKAITDWGYKTFEIGKLEDVQEKIATYEGNTIEQKIASIEAERDSLDPISATIRGPEYEEMIRVARTGEMNQYDSLGDRITGKEKAGGDTGVSGVVSGDLRQARADISGSDTTTIQVVDTILENTERRAEANDKLAGLRAELQEEKDPKKRLETIDLITEQANSLRKLQEESKALLEANVKLFKAALKNRDERREKVGLTPMSTPTGYQTGGVVGNISQTGGRQNALLDERSFSTTDFAKGDTIVKKQEGGLVLFQGHGDVPAGHAAPGTDGPGMNIEGKYKPTAEQYWIDQVASKAEALAQKEGVALKYQRPMGKFASASNPKSNWSTINRLRGQGQAAVELHFDAWGYQGEEYIEGKRGMLTSGNALIGAEKELSSSFGTHPLSGKGWGTMMLELDPLKYATSRTDKYARMLVDSVKNSDSDDESTSEEVAPGEYTTGDLSTLTPTDILQQQSTNQDMSMGSLLNLGGMGSFISTFLSEIGGFLGDELGGAIGGLFSGQQKTSAEKNNDFASMLFGGGSTVVNSPISYGEGNSDGEYNADVLMKYAKANGITDKTELAMFMSQMGHESGSFLHRTEIASGSAYEGSSTLGNTQPGDGARYKGRGYVQLTGRWNYNHYGDMIGVDLVNNPELAADPDVALKVAVAYWNDRVDRKAARKGDINAVTKDINGGFNGLADRQQRFSKWQQKLQKGGLVDIGMPSGAPNNISTSVDTPIAPAIIKAVSPSTNTHTTKTITEGSGSPAPQQKLQNGGLVDIGNPSGTSTNISTSVDTPIAPAIIKAVSPVTNTHTTKTITEGSGSPAPQQKLQNGGVVGAKTPTNVSPSVQSPIAPAIIKAVSPVTNNNETHTSKTVTNNVTTSAAPMAPQPLGSVHLSKTPDSTYVRMHEAQESNNAKPKKSRPTVIVTGGGGGGRAPLPQPAQPSVPGASSSGGLNMVEARKKLHRLNAGAMF